MKSNLPLPYTPTPFPYIFTKFCCGSRYEYDLLNIFNILFYAL